MQEGCIPPGRVSMRVAGLEIGVSDLLALVALIVSGLSYWANRGMAAANKSMAESNLTMAETNKSMAASADVSAQAARDAMSVQRRAEQIAQKACLHLAVDQGYRGVEFFEEEVSVQDSKGNKVGTGWINFFLRNEGKAPAMNCRLKLHTMDVPGRLRIEGDAHKRIGPGEVGKLGFSVPYLPLRELEHEIDFSARVEFEDGLGPDTLLLGINFYPTTAADHSSNVPWGFKMIPEMQSRSWLCSPPEYDEPWESTPM
jgi:hypothetical protein